MSELDNIINSAVSDAKVDTIEPSVDDASDLEEQVDAPEPEAENAEDEGADDVEQTLEKLKKGNKKKLNYIRNLILHW